MARPADAMMPPVAAKGDEIDVRHAAGLAGNPHPTNRLPVSIGG
jgi:hypothetical protein